VALVLALEPDVKQAAVLKQIVRERVGADFVLADSKDVALAAISERVPDLILVTALLSPRDEADLTGHLRALDGAEHLQTLTIPLLASGPATAQKKKKRGLLSALTGEAERPEAPAGCDPAVFAEEIRNYIARAEELRVSAVVERKRTTRTRKRTPTAGAEQLQGRERENGPAAESGTASAYWAWESTPAVAEPESAKAPAGGQIAEAASRGSGHSSWDNPWDVSHRSAGVAEGAPRPESIYIDDHILAAADVLPLPPAIDALDALLERPSVSTAGDLLAGPVEEDLEEEIDLSDLLGETSAGREGSAGAQDSVDAGASFYTVSPTARDIEALLNPVPDASIVAEAGKAPASEHAPGQALEAAVVQSAPPPPPVAAEQAAASPNAADLTLKPPVSEEKLPVQAVSADVPPEPDGPDMAALEALQADLERMRADRGLVEVALAEARAAQQRAEAAVAEAAQRAAEESERRTLELAQRAREEAEADRRVRELGEQKAREEAEHRAEAERMARQEAERLTREIEARMREEAAAERRLREEAEREAASARAREAARRSEREEGERKARLEAERRAEDERMRRQEAEARIEAERKAREQVERRAREQAERLAREAEERRAREVSERKARQQAERQAREAERQARAAERQAREVERQAREAAELETRVRSQRLIRESEERRAREAAQLKTREASERRAREMAERRAEVERLAREAAERKALEQGERHAETERAAREAIERKVRAEADQLIEAERKARLDAEHQAKREAERRAAAERRAQEDAERLAAEAAARAKRVARSERRARELAEKRAAVERKAREMAERRAREESVRRAAAEARARQEEERLTREKAARPIKKAPVVRRARRRGKPEPIVATLRSEGKDDRPLQDEWGLYDPDKCGFGALYAKLEDIENGGPSEEESDASNLIADEQEGIAPVRFPRPLSMWAWRVEESAVPVLGAGNPGQDDFRELVSGLAIPSAVAAVGYASGARIRRVTVPPPAEPASKSERGASVLILSRRLLKAARQQSTGTRRLTARR
jgi:hypothetical protein